MRIYVSVRFNVLESLGGHGRIQGDFKSPVYTTQGIMRNTANISSHSNQKSHHDNPHCIICLNHKDLYSNSFLCHHLEREGRVH